MLNVVVSSFPFTFVCVELSSMANVTFPTRSILLADIFTDSGEALIADTTPFFDTFNSMFEALVFIDASADETRFPKASKSFFLAKIVIPLARLFIPASTLE